MAIFTFSTKGSEPKDTEDIEKIKKYCRANGLNFSAVVIKKLKEWHKEELANGKR